MTDAVSSTTTTSQSWQVAAQARNDDRKNRMDKAMSGVADLLDMSVDDIRQAQQSGTTIADLAKQKGVSEDDLQSALAQGLNENAPSDAPSDVDFSQMASDIINGKGPQGPGGHHGHGPKPPESDGSNSASGLQQLLQNTGIDSTQLQDLLESSLSSDASTNSSTTSSSTSDFAAQLKNLISQYGSKGLTYDTKL
jgi:hypothetical protein